MSFQPEFNEKIFYERVFFEKGIRIRAISQEVQFQIESDAGDRLFSLDPSGRVSKDGINPAVIAYDHTVSGLSSITVQGAIDELAAAISGGATLKSFVQGGNTFGALAVLGTADANDLSFVSNGAERARFLSTGEFGIGITDPSTPLDMGGALSVRGSIAPALAPAGQGRIYFDGTTKHFYASEDGGAYTLLVGGGLGSVFSQGGNTFGSNAVLGTTDNFGLDFITNNTNTVSIQPTGQLTSGTVPANPADISIASSQTDFSTFYPAKALSASYVVNPSINIDGPVIGSAFNLTIPGTNTKNMSLGEGDISETSVSVTADHAGSGNVQGLCGIDTVIGSTSVTNQYAINAENDLVNASSSSVGLRLFTQVSSAGTVATNYGIFIRTPFVSPGSTLTTNYGLYVDTQAAVGIGSAYAIITNGGNVTLNNSPLGLGGDTTHQLELTNDDAVKPTTNTWTIASDIRIKENIVPFTDGLSTLKKLSPVKYELNGLAGTVKGTPGIGLIAQEAKDHIPYSISKHKSRLNADDEHETELYNFNAHALTFVLINAVKEQAEQIRKLSDRISELERG